MPRTTRRKLSKAVGPFDLSTRKLPGGTEMEALATGIALELERGLGYQSGYKTAAKLANLNNLADASPQQPWIVADVKTGLLRSHNAPQLFTTYPREMVEIFTDPDKHDGNI